MCKTSHKYKLSPVVIRENEKGTILVLVLWVIALLTMVAGYFSVETRLRGNMGHGTWNLLKSKLEIESVLNLAAVYMAPLEQDSDTDDPDHFLLADGSTYKVFINGRDLEFTIEDERGKIDLNKVSEETLATVLDGLLGAQDENIASNLTDAILDWRDNDDDKRPHGAEKEYYQALSPSYEPSNSKFMYLEQLLLVKDMKPNIYWGPIKWQNVQEKEESPAWKGGLQDIFTVYNQGGNVIKAAAPEPLLKILDEKDLSDKGGKGTIRLKACLYQGCYQVFWDPVKDQNKLFKLVHWQQIPRFD